MPPKIVTPKQIHADDFWRFCSFALEGTRKDWSALADSRVGLST